MTRKLELLATSTFTVLACILFYSRATGRSIRQSILDAVRLIFLSTLGSHSKRQSWLKPGSVIPSNQYMAIAALCRIAKNSSQKQIERGSYTLKDMRMGMEVLQCFYETPGIAANVQPVDANGVPAFWVSSAGVPSDAPILLEFHGGGYVSGAARHHIGYLSYWCRELKMRALTVDYRLAPEHVMPACVEDALVVYKWIIKDVNPSKICITGASAGGGI